jgi:HD-GYP domain-containing protein (c-di-GMP phosphodiesterase class II)
MTAMLHTYDRQAASRGATPSDPVAGLALLAELSALMERRDAYTHGHGRRVAHYAGQIARAMHLPILEATRIRKAGAIHDVGKLATPRAILNNPRRLTAAEYAVLQRHAADGAEMVAAIGDARITEMVRHHHERVDARGYPDGLAGSQIPLGARVIAVADTFDALTSDRAYRPAASRERALDVIAEHAGTQLDAGAVATFLSCGASSADNLLDMQSPLSATMTWR